MLLGVKLCFQSSVSRGRKVSVLVKTVNRKSLRDWLMAAGRNDYFQNHGTRFEVTQNRR